MNGEGDNPLTSLGLLWIVQRPNLSHNWLLTAYYLTCASVKCPLAKFAFITPQNTFNDTASIPVYSTHFNFRHPARTNLFPVACPPLESTDLGVMHNINDAARHLLPSPQ